VSAPRLTPYLCVEDGRAALAWYAEALGARVVATFLDPSGRMSPATREA
jgi:uncharacterized glyoxalase superfamily protein PhnB